MNNSEVQMTNDLLEFSRQSLQWCLKESEKSTFRINEIINNLMSDAKRVASMSKETLDAFEKAREIIDNLVNVGDRKVANEIGLLLKGMSDKNAQIQQTVMPIIEALQFQDRITQNMDHVTEVIRMWLEMRSKVMEKGSFTDEDKVELGQKYCDLVTMGEERDCVVKHIPNIPEPQHDDGLSLFF